MVAVPDIRSIENQLGMITIFCDDRLDLMVESIEKELDSSVFTLFQSADASDGRKNIVICLTEGGIVIGKGDYIGGDIISRWTECLRRILPDISHYGIDQAVEGIAEIYSRGLPIPFGYVLLRKPVIDCHADHRPQEGKRSVKSFVFDPLDDFRIPAGGTLLISVKAGGIFCGNGRSPHPYDFLVSIVMLRIHFAQRNPSIIHSDPVRNSQKQHRIDFSDYIHIVEKRICVSVCQRSQEISDPGTDDILQDLRSFSAEARVSGESIDVMERRNDDHPSFIASILHIFCKDIFRSSIRHFRHFRKSESHGSTDDHFGDVMRNARILRFGLVRIGQTPFPI